MSEKLIEMRRQYRQCVYQSATHTLRGNDLELAFSYVIEPGAANTPLHFTHRLVIKNVDPTILAALPANDLQSAVFSIGMVEMLSYWKTTCAAQIVVEAGSLSPDQIKWWHNLLIQGMGEYFFVNQIDFTAPDFVTIVAKVADSAPPSAFATPPNLAPATSIPTANQSSTPSKILIPVGGGKDSALSIELLKTHFPADQLACLLINPTLAAQDLSRMSGLATFQVQRLLDPQLLNVNQQGYLNGHVPFSASVAFISTLAAKLWGYSSLPVSNERSSNEGSVWFHGHYVNHQYSKTYDFENSFQEYVARYLPLGDQTPAYFSFLRPLYELQIGRLFAKYGLAQPQVLSHFRSCNRGKNTNAWCGECSKCLFTYAILYPFLDHQLMVDIFGQDLWAKIELWPIAAELLGYAEKKPLECVGTHEENVVAFHLSYQKLLTSHADIPPLLERAMSEIARQENQATTDSLNHRSRELLTAWNSAHSLPPVFETLLKREFLPPSPAQIIVFGLGREGMSSYHYLRNKYPHLPVVMIDDRHLTELPTTVQHLIADPSSRVVFKQSSTPLDPRFLEQLIEVNRPTLLVKSAGIPHTHPLLIQAAKLIDAQPTHDPSMILTTNTQLFFDELATHAHHHYTTIGITGTKGKSTTSSLVYQVLKQGGLPTVLGGNIGKPPLDLLAELDDLVTPTQPNATIVLEMSCHQLSDLKTSPQIAIIQNITPEHLDYYASFADYVAAKSQIARFQRPTDQLIYNPDFSSAATIAKLSPGHHHHLTDVTVENGYLQYQGQTVVAEQDVPLKGAFNLQNVFPSIIVGHLLGLDSATIGRAISSFTPLAHRLELVGTVHEVAYYNDSLSTTPVATMAALESFKDHPIILIAGGYDRHLEYAELAASILTHHVKALILFPDTGERIWSEIKKINPQVNLTPHFTSNMAEAVLLAAHAAQAGDVVLMSPASASFNHFKDYQDRGHQFATAVAQLQ